MGIEDELTEIKEAKRTLKRWKALVCKKYSLTNEIKRTSDHITHCGDSLDHNERQKLEDDNCNKINERNYLEDMMDC